jgi:methyltransferase (TIGR00027 family)
MTGVLEPFQLGTVGSGERRDGGCKKEAHIGSGGLKLGISSRVGTGSPGLVRRGQPSRTSSLVTLLRALSHEGLTEVGNFSDPTALVFLSSPWRWIYRRTLRSVARRPDGRQRMLERSRGRMDLIALRTRFFDDAWHAAHAAGTRQLVLLGAGLDGRAFRLDDISDSIVFEVDHPSTQAVKRERARWLSSKAMRHIYVPVDFERDDLGEALAAARHANDQRTFWLWEGVTPYLTPEAQIATMRAVAARSVPGSRLAMTYVEPEPEPSPIFNIRTLVRVLGEPFRGEMTRATAAERLSLAGLRVVEDTGSAEWRRRYTDVQANVSDVIRERIAVAEV